LVHGDVKGQAENVNVEVNGVAGQIALGSAPVAVFGDVAGIDGQNTIAASLAMNSSPRCWSNGGSGERGGADLFTRPPGAIWEGDCHNLFANEGG
jgi:hypothetical protein